MIEVPKRGRDAWIGEGGNPRTDQRKTFTMYDNIAKTKQTFEVHEREQKARDAVTYAPDGTANRLDPEAQTGRRMHVNELVRKVKLMNPDVIFEVTTRNPDLAGLYVEVRGNDLKTGLPGKYKRLVTGLENGWMPEFTIMDAVMEDRPGPEGTLSNVIKHAYPKVRGWRTALAKLHKAGLITEAQIEKHFKIAEGRDSELWQKQIHAPITVA